MIHRRIVIPARGTDGCQFGGASRKHRDLRLFVFGFPIKVGDGPARNIDWDGR